MRRFARLLELLAFTQSRNARIAHLQDAWREMPDPDRGYALAAVTGELELRSVTPSLLKTLAAEVIDPELFALSYDFVGDLAETVALIWPAQSATPSGLSLSQAVTELQRTPRPDLPKLIAERLSHMPATERYAYLKLATGGLRVGVSGRLARQALAGLGGVDIAGIEELWHGLSPPYTALFDWLLDGGPKPVSEAPAPFRPVLLATPLDQEDLRALDTRDWVADWKWDGVRVQAVSDQGTRRLYSRTGEDMSAAFPDLLEALGFDGVLDGELLIRRGAAVAPFSDLQKRLGRKRVGKALRTSHPATLRAYDILIWQGEDLRPLPFEERHKRLRDVITALEQPRIDLSEPVPFESWQALADLRDAPPQPVIEGLMLKHRASPYLAGRKRGHWFKWKRDPMLIDAVMLYAQRGHGKRSGFYSDFTFGVWDGDDLVPVGKAYFGFTDAELRKLDAFVRHNTTERFGPVRAVRPEMVLEVAFEGLNRSSRHKSGLAMRFPRINRIRDDKPAREADTLDALRALLPVE